MKDHKTARTILLIGIVAAAIMIFLFSAQNAEESQKTSDRLTNSVVRLVEPNYDELPSAKRLSLRQQVGRVIRKLGHFSEFALLGGLLFSYLNLSPRKKSVGWAILRALAAAALYACTDEIHQMFVAGRGPSPVDVGIDSLGALTGIMALAGLWRLCLRLRKNRR